MRATEIVAIILFIYPQLSFIDRMNKGSAGRPAHVATAERGLSLKSLANFPVPASSEPITVMMEPGSHEMYLIDAVLGKIQRLNWKTGERERWITLDPAACPSKELHILSTSIMKTQPVLLVLDCRHIEILDKATLTRTRSVAVNTEFEIYGFVLSPDEHSLFVGVKRQGKESTLIYRTEDWKMSGELDIGYGSFSPNGQGLFTTFLRRRKPSSLAADECGFEFYEPRSGQKISEFVRSAEGNDDVCPEARSRSVPGQPNRIVTTDSLRGAISEWDLSDGTLIQHLESKTRTPGPAPGIESLDISFDGKLAAVVTSRREWGMEWGITIWDLLNGEKVYETPLGPQVNPVMRAEFFPEDYNLVFVYSNHVEIYEYAFTK